MCDGQSVGQTVEPMHYGQNDYEFDSQRTVPFAHPLAYLIALRGSLHPSTTEESDTFLFAVLEFGH